jgi:hypothetical protein
MTAEEDVWAIPTHLCEIPHLPLIPPRVERRLYRVDRRLFEAGLVGRVEH